MKIKLNGRLAPPFLLESLADLFEGEKVYGWSGGSPAALLFCAVLCCNSKRDKQCTLINRMFTEYVDGGLYFYSDSMNDKEPAITFLEQVSRGLAEMDISKDDFGRHLASALQNGQKIGGNIKQGACQTVAGRGGLQLYYGNLHEMV